MRMNCVFLSTSGTFYVKGPDKEKGGGGKRLLIVIFYLYKAEILIFFFIVSPIFRECSVG